MTKLHAQSHVYITTGVGGTKDTGITDKAPFWYHIMPHIHPLVVLWPHGSHQITQ